MERDLERILDSLRGFRLGMSPSTLKTFSPTCALRAGDGKLRVIPHCTGPPGWLLELPALCTVSPGRYARCPPRQVSRVKDSRKIVDTRKM